MRTKLIITTFIASWLSTGSMQAQLSSNPDKFLGNITTSGQIDFGTEKFYQLWNQITPENETKWESVQRNSQNSWNWGSVDNINNYAKNHNFPFKFHTLVWGSQFPSWVKNLSVSARYNAIVKWMDEVKKRYPDLAMIDVVNEAIDGHQPDTHYISEALGGPGKTGYDWIIKAFEMAYERWPEAILIYNDFNTFQWNTDQFIDLVRTLRDAGAPVDAYGCQSHDLTGCSATTLKNSMNKIQNALKMPMYITEYDIGDNNDTNQLRDFKAQIPLLWEADYCAGVTLWGYIYGHTWTNEGAGYSGIIKEVTENGKKIYKDRPAMTWLREYMQTDAAKNAKSPFPGMVKEASVYIKPASITVTKGDKVPIEVRAKMKTKLIDHIDLYVKDMTKPFVTLTEAPYTTEYEATTTGKHDMKAVVVNTDGTSYERLGAFTAYNPRQPYKGVIDLPGTIQGEDFDSGADGISYHDNDSQNQGTAKSYRTDGASVDIESISGGYAIGYISNNEWLEYTVNVKEAGLYEYDMYVSSQDGGGAYSWALSDDNGLTDLTGTVSAVKTGAWSTYKVQHGRFTKELTEGQQVLRFSVKSGTNAFNFDKIILRRVDVDNTMSVSIKADPSPATVGTATSITINASSATSTIKDVKVYIDQVLTKTLATEPFTYSYIPSAKGSVKFTAIATDAEGRQSKIASYTLTVNAKRTAYKTVNLPGTIEAENFDKGGEGFTFHDSDSKDEGDAKYRTDNEGIDLVKGNGGTALGYTAANEWTEYTVNVTQAGKYAYEATVSSGVTGSGFTIGLKSSTGSITSLAKVNVPQTGNNNWDTYKTVKGNLSTALQEGQQIIRFTINGQNCNIDKVKFECTEPVDGILVQTAQPTNATVYNIYGVKVGTTSSWQSLPRGIYIVNGRKVTK